MRKKDRKLLSKFNSQSSRKPVFRYTKLPREIPLFIKFVDRNYVSRFLKKGELHFGGLSEYRNIASPGVYSDINTTIGDLDEDVLHREFGEGSKIEINKQRAKLTHNEYGTFRSVLHPNAAAFCFTAVPRKFLHSVGGNTYKIDSILIEKLLRNFPPKETVPVILNNIGYIWEMVKIQARNVNKARGPVIYTDNQGDAISTFKSKTGVTMDSHDIVPFTKKLRYREQYEYRFLLEDGKVLDNNGNLIIGSLKGKAHRIQSLSNIYIQVETAITKKSGLEMYKDLKYHSFYKMSLLEFTSKCYQGIYKVGMPDNLIK